ARPPPHAGTGLRGGRDSPETRRAAGRASTRPLASPAALPASDPAGTGPPASVDRSSRPTAPVVTDRPGLAIPTAWLASRRLAERAGGPLPRSCAPGWPIPRG